MAAINLLTAATGVIKRPVPIVLTKANRAAVLILVISALFFAAAVYLRMQGMFQERGLTAVLERKRQNELIVKKLNELKVEQGLLQQEEALLQNIPNSTMHWADKLTRLRALLPPEIWLSRFAYDKKSDQKNESARGVLTLKGSLVSQQDKKPLEILSAFLNQLTSEKAFLDFGAPELKDMHADTYQKKAITSFTLEMTPNKPEVPSLNTHQ